MFSNDSDPEQQREQMRLFYCDAWQKHLDQKAALSPLEQQITAVVKEHPEYHQLLENKEASINADYLPEMGDSNPFLHMGMHLGLREQVSTDRPTGITELYKGLVALKGVHDAEHEMIECLAEAIWQAQQNQTTPDEVAYLECLGKIEQRNRKRK